MADWRRQGLSALGALAAGGVKSLVQQRVDSSVLQGAKQLAGAGFAYFKQAQGKHRLEQLCLLGAPCTTLEELRARQPAAPSWAGSGPGWGAAAERGVPAAERGVPR